VNRVRERESTGEHTERVRIDEGAPVNTERGRGRVRIDEGAPVNMPRPSSSPERSRPGPCRREGGVRARNTPTRHDISIYNGRGYN
jgi:hypothetical protein